MTRVLPFWVKREACPHVGSLFTDPAAKGGLAGLPLETVESRVFRVVESVPGGRVGLHVGMSCCSPVSASPSRGLQLAVVRLAFLLAGRRFGEGLPLPGELPHCALPPKLQRRAKGPQRSIHSLKSSLGSGPCHHSGPDVSVEVGSLGASS